MRTSTPVAAVDGGNVHLVNGDSVAFDAVILTTGHHEIAQTEPLGRIPVRGQSVIGKLSGNLRTVIGGPAAMIPLGAGDIVASGTFDPHVTDTEIRDDDTRRLTEAVGQCVTAPFSPTSAWAGVRSTTRDRQPVAGRTPDWEALTRHCLSRDDSAPFQQWQTGVFLCTGFGSHGATTAPLLAEAVARQVTGEAGCLGIAGAGRMNAARFQLRDAGRRRDVIALGTRAPREH